MSTGMHGTIVKAYLEGNDSMCTDLQVFSCNNTHSSTHELCRCNAIDLNAVLGCPVDESSMLLTWI